MRKNILCSMIIMTAIIFGQNVNAEINFDIGALEIISIEKQDIYINEKDSTIEVFLYLNEEADNSYVFIRDRLIRLKKEVSADEKLYRFEYEKSIFTKEDLQNIELIENLSDEETKNYLMYEYEHEPEDSPEEELEKEISMEVISLESDVQETVNKSEHIVIVEEKPKAVEQSIAPQEPIESNQKVTEVEKTDVKKTPNGKDLRGYKLVQDSELDGLVGINNQLIAEKEVPHRMKSKIKMEPRNTTINRQDTRLYNGLLIFSIISVVSGILIKKRVLKRKCEEN